MFLADVIAPSFEYFYPTEETHVLPFETKLEVPRCTFVGINFSPCTSVSGSDTPTALGSVEPWFSKRISFCTFLLSKNAVLISSGGPCSVDSKMTSLLFSGKSSLLSAFHVRGT